MKIQQITDDKKRYLDILLLADPQENMINKYLEQGKMFVLSEAGVIKTVAVVVVTGDRRCELKNIATIEEERGKGYGRNLIQYICEHYSESCDEIYVGTGKVPRSIHFYESCGFELSHTVSNFFTDNYVNPIIDDGILLKDMVYLKKKLETVIDVKRVVNFALEAGKLLLKSGAEIFRAEDTITRICNRYHIYDINVFTLGHAIFITAGTGKEDAYTKVINVPLPSTHLGVVAKVNALSREITAGGMTIEEAEEKLEEIKKTPPLANGLQILGAGMGSGFLGYLLGATITESVIAFASGCILYVWLLLAKKSNVSKIITNIIGGVVITAVALIAQQMTVLDDLQLSGMISGAIMPLVPGVAFTNAIRDIADSDFLSGTVRMIDALLVFVYIAIGVGFTLTFYNLVLGGAVL
ncbi:MAG: GNAT family N-acetyltransferase [Dorea sp.]